MPLRILVSLVALIAAPLLMLGWLSASSMRQDRATVEQQVNSVLRGRLVEIDDSLKRFFDDTSRSLGDQVQRSVGDSIVPTTALARLPQTQPLVRRLIVINADSQMIFPPPPNTTDPSRIEEYAALVALAASRPRVDHESAGKQLGPSKVATTRRGSTALTLPAPKYHVWYRDEGTQLSLWWPREDGSTIGLLLERSRWIAEITARLPDSPMQDVRTSNSLRDDLSLTVASVAPLPIGITTINDESGRVIYRWGDGDKIPVVPRVTIPISEPLASWHLRYYSHSALVPPIRFTGLYAALAGVGVILIALGVYVLTSLQRQIRLAKQRVTFAGQVSHELRTPLTNIRLYAELAERDVDMLEDSGASRLGSRLSVIQGEARRLSRLVSGVMEIIREDGRVRALNIQPQNADALIDSVTTQFEPGFQAAGIRLERIRGADRVIGFDADCLEMILVNLFSNVEKYAASGGFVKVESQLKGQHLVVLVSDAGPGIAARHRSQVFKPFRRLDDSVTAPSGTGIGLTIARRVARRHGGDVRLVPVNQGACFEVDIVWEQVDAT